MPLPKSDLSDKIFSKLHIGLELLMIIPYIFHKIKPFKAVRILSPFNVCLRRFFAAFPVFLTNLWEYAKMIPQIKNERLLFMAEFWDIYDEERHKTGKLHKRGLPLAEGEYHLVIHVWVRNSNGDFLITRRSPGKNLFPGKWECTGGSALVGEDSEAAALRETLEETGIDHTKSIRRCVLSFRKKNWFGDIWLFQADFPSDKIHLQAEETVDFMWAEKRQILDFVKNGDFCPYDYIEHFFTLI